MGNTREFTLVAERNAIAQGCAVVVDAKLVNKTPVAKLATAGAGIDGIVTDITITGDNEVTLAVARTGDIVFGLIGGEVTVGDELVVGAEGKLVKAGSGVAVAKALNTGKAGERIEVLIK